MKFEEWLSQQNSVIEVDCGCVTTEAFYHWMRVAYEAGNSPVIPDGWTCNDKANAALMMLDRIETADPVDDDRIDGIKRIVRELAAAPHDTPALNSVQSVDSVADRWIPVSERIPEDRKQVILWDAEIGEVTSGHYSHKTQTFYHCGDAIENEITHWMPPPCAPQEVK
ncbi:MULTISPECIES: DUF551 domain-containing protein [Klebsiella pneumoniae complex]|jgi:hypothetical protein|uniref:DUF551 domain-containing protein n=1 Tax=Klebsiella pneumoniae complex TaxID=3390273 RepID=UPI0010F74932|nr:MULTISPECIES: DUF551 domain-containing protein [Klebsiella]DAM68764.1 MAG TPA: Protein of unknown function (DUF551) [Caudoviricetes sp.]MCM6148266.1 DUF551 domain-containing protein [Klebsiella pneumoniae]MCY0507062.1 DUF551 domain-containing protein [Klebsiella pneumoniae]MDG0355173.1 DUF551 domain-containing protein [Klebsiella pneumoniae]GKL47687.1 hypothetical protein NUBL21992_37710 [Klebsiella pneumoniae]